MAKDTLQQFTELHSALLNEKAELEARLQKIDQALKLGTSPAPAAAAATQTKVKAKAVRKKVARAKNELSLREAIIKVLGAKALTKEEILEGVKALGYKFATAEPMGSVNAVLYAKKPKFKNEDGKFSAPA